MNDYGPFVGVWGGGRVAESSLDFQMTCMEGYEIKPLAYKTFIEETNYLHTIGRLENDLVYLH